MTSSPGDAAAAHVTEVAPGSVVLEAAAPVAVSDVTASNDYDRGTIEVSWVVPEPVDATVTAYVVTVDGTAYSTQATASDRHVSLGELTLAPGTYDVSVVARNPDGDSAPTTAHGVIVAAIAPSAPRNLTASEATPGEVTLTWETPAGSGTSDLSLYFMSLERPGADAILINLQPGDTTFTFSWLSAATYTVSLKARNEEYMWGPTSTTSYTVVPAAPTAPRDVEVSQFEFTPGDIDVAWTGPVHGGTSDIVEYTVTLASADLTLTHVVDPVGSNDRTTSPDLPSGVYTATVTVTNAEDLTSPAGTSQEIEVLAVAPTAPEAVEVHVDGPREVSVSWLPPSDTGTSAVDYYEVYLLHGYSGTRTPVQRVTGPDGASFTGLPYGTHYAHVYAVNLDGLTGEDGVSAWFDVDRVAPTAPREVVAVLSALTEITATWAAPVDTGTSGIDRYTVTLTNASTLDGTADLLGTSDPRDLAAASSGSTQIVPAGAPLAATFDDVLPGTYTVTVTATNLDGATSPLAASGALTVEAVPPSPDGTVPSAPRNLSVTQTGPRQVTVRFDAAAHPGSSPVTGYSIGVSSSTAAGGDVYPATVRTQVFDDIDPDTYLFSVRAFNAVGGGPFTEATVVVRADWAPPATVPVVVPPVTMPLGAPVLRPATNEVEEPRRAPAAGTLAQTGTDAGAVALAALVVVGAGATALTGARRRRHQGQPG